MSSVARLAEYLAPGLPAHRVRLPHHTMPMGRRRAARPPSPARSPPTAMVGAPVTWVLSNHDIDRHVTRYGRRPDGTPVARPAGRSRRPTAGHASRARRDPDGAGAARRGLPVSGRRARTAAGRRHPRSRCWPIPCGNGRDAPAAAATVVECRCRGLVRGRRSGSATREPWLPQPQDWSALSVEAEEADRTSMLWLYRDALRPAATISRAARRRAHVARHRRRRDGVQPRRPVRVRRQLRCRLDRPPAGRGAVVERSAGRRPPAHRRSGLGQRLGRPDDVEPLSPAGRGRRRATAAWSGAATRRRCARRCRGTAGRTRRGRRRG